MCYHLLIKRKIGPTQKDGNTCRTYHRSKHRPPRVSLCELAHQERRKKGYMEPGIGERAGDEGLNTSSRRKVSRTELHICARLRETMRGRRASDHETSCVRFGRRFKESGMASPHVCVGSTCNQKNQRRPSRQLERCHRRRSRRRILADCQRFE